MTKDRAYRAAVVALLVAAVMLLAVIAWQVVRLRTLVGHLPAALLWQVCGERT